MAVGPGGGQDTVWRCVAWCGVAAEGGGGWRTAFPVATTRDKSARRAAAGYSQCRRGAGAEEDEGLSPCSRAVFKARNF